MSGIDDRVVSISFDNQEFERRLGETLDSLDRLSESLKFVEGADGLSTLADHANSFDMSGMESAIENVSDKLSVLGAIGFSVIQELTQNVLAFASRVGSKVIEPLIFGGKTRATNIENAKFQFRGLGIDVEAGMASALKAVKGTAFGLDEAAKAAAQFGASGIEAGDDMTTALRGIAGAAAITNTGFAEIADIFTSAAGAGKVTGQDLARFATRGLNAAAALGKQMGKTELEVKQMASEGELSFDLFSKSMDAAFGEHATKANETFTGAMANMRAAISRIGASFFGPRQEQMRDFFNALTPVIDGVNDALQPLITTFLRITGESTKGLISFLEGLDLTNFTAGMKAISEGVGNIFDAFTAIGDLAKEAFQEIFPASETSKFLSFSEAFRDFTEKLKMGGETAQKIKDIFRGVFAVLSIGAEIVKEIFLLFVDLVGGSFGTAGGGVLDFVSNLGGGLASLKEALVDGGGIKSFFEGLGQVIRHPIESLKAFFGLFSGSDIPGAEGVSDVLGRVGQRLGMLGTLAEKAGEAWQWLMDRFEGVRKVLSVIWGHISTWFSELGQKLAAVMKPGDFDAVLDALNVGLLGGIAVLFKKFLDNGLSLDLSGGVLSNLSGIFEEFTGVLQGMQTELKAKALVKIATAIGILTASVLVLSLIDSGALTKALTALAVGFGQLVGAVALLDKMSVSTSAIKLGGIATAMVIMAAAILVLSFAVKNLSSLGWEELAKGLLGVTVLLEVLGATAKRLEEGSSGLIRAGIAMSAMAIALLILSFAVKSFADLSWEEMAKGLIGIGVGLGIITFAMTKMPTSGMVQAGIGIVAISTGLLILAQAVKSFADLSWDELGHGLAGVGVSLLIIVTAMNLMPESGMVQAGVGLLAISVGLLVMSKAVAAFGGMDLGTLAKGIGAIAAMLLVLAVALKGMSGTAAGSASLVIASGALLILTEVLAKLGELSIGQIVAALVTLAATLAILGVGAALLQPLIPALLGLGLALGLIGASFALFGIGASLVAKAMETMARSGRASIKALIDSMELLISALPQIVNGLVQALLDIADTLIKAAPVFVKAIGVLIQHILETITELVPEIGAAFGAIVTEWLRLIQELLPEFIKAGLTILLSLMQGIRDNIFEITTLAVEILTNFVNALAANVIMLVDAAVNFIMAFTSALAARAQDLVTAGVNLLVSLLSGISNEISRVTDAVANLIIVFLLEITKSLLQITEAGLKLLVALLKGISDNIIKVVDAVTEIVTKFITNLGENADKIITAGAKVLTDLLQGIGDNIEKVVTTVGTIITKFTTAVGDKATELVTSGTAALIKFLEGVGDGLEQVVITAKVVVLKFLATIANEALALANGAADLLIDFLNGLADAIRDKAPLIREAGRNIASAIIEGITGGLSSKAGDVATAAVNVAKNAVGKVAGFLGINSPSKVFISIGKSMAEGMVYALDRDKTAADSAVGLVDRVATGFQKALAKIPKTIEGLDDFNPTITPILDLTKVETAANGLNKMLGISTITPEVSYGQARTISKTSEIATNSPEGTNDTGPTEVTFEQNIYAPQALSTNDIYRNTKSQIALAKEELSIA